MNFLTVSDAALYQAEYSVATYDSLTVCCGSDFLNFFFLWKTSGEVKTEDLMVVFLCGSLHRKGLCGSLVLH